MYLELLQDLGLSKNEAEIYESLLDLGEVSVSGIAAQTNINRRNIYDVLSRMTEKGLVFPIIDIRETRYKAVDPGKLLELIKEKEGRLQKALPDLQKLYHSKPKSHEVFIYRGAEGWKNYMLDLIRIGEPAYFIAAKGGWLDARVKHFYPQFYKETQRKKISFKHLFEWDVKTHVPQIFEYVKSDYKFLPKGYSAPAAVDFFGDHVNIITPMRLGGFEDDDISITVIVNKTIATSFRVWFQFMWDSCPDVKQRQQ